jgi:biopolymer transport protein ExbD
MVVPMNLTRFHVVPKGDGVEITIEIDGKGVITANAALEQVEEMIDALEDALRAGDDDEDVVIDEG